MQIHGHYHSSGGSIWDNLRKWWRDKNRAGVNLDKRTLRILFIDDHKFPIVDNLKKADYQVEWIRDIKKIDDPRVINSHIIFVDYKGVGKNLSDKEGIGVSMMLKNEYGDSKYLIVFSGENIPNNLIQEIKSASDDILSKSNDTSEFIRVIEEGLNTLKA